MTNTPAIFPKRAHVLATQIWDRFGLKPSVGVEKEFYLAGTINSRDFVGHNQRRLRSEIQLFQFLTNESGRQQFEYSVQHTTDMEALCDAVTTIDRAIESAAAAARARVDWRALPYSDQPPSGLHLHISLHDRNGANRLAKESADVDAPESVTMLACIAGLLDTMADFVVAFAPTEACYRRLQERSYPEVYFAPAHVSWGADNRTTALRLPPTGSSPSRRRIEHRLGSPCADIQAAVTAVLAGVNFGLARGTAPVQAKTYGLANNPDLKLPLLPMSLELAIRRFLSHGNCYFSPTKLDCD